MNSTLDRDVTYELDRLRAFVNTLNVLRNRMESAHFSSDPSNLATVFTHRTGLVVSMSNSLPEFRRTNSERFSCAPSGHNPHKAFVDMRDCLLGSIPSRNVQKLIFCIATHHLVGLKRCYIRLFYIKPVLTWSCEGQPGQRFDLKSDTRKNSSLLGPWIVERDTTELIILIEYSTMWHNVGTDQIIMHDILYSTVLGS